MNKKYNQAAVSYTHSIYIIAKLYILCEVLGACSDLVILEYLCFTLLFTSVHIYFLCIYIVFSSEKGRRKEYLSVAFNTHINHQERSLKKTPLPASGTWWVRRRISLGRENSFISHPCLASKSSQAFIKDCGCTVRTSTQEPGSGLE